MARVSKGRILPGKVKSLGKNVKADMDKIYGFGEAESDVPENEVNVRLLRNAADIVLSLEQKIAVLDGQIRIVNLFDRLTQGTCGGYSESNSGYITMRLRNLADQLEKESCVKSKI